MEYGLKQEGLLSFVRELNGNEDESYDNYLKDASMYARGEYPFYIYNFFMVIFIYFIEILLSFSFSSRFFLLFLFYETVVILSVRGMLVRKFMLAAHALGMTKGDWTFLDVEIFQVYFCLFL